jgi:hypothetical protein
MRLTRNRHTYLTLCACGLLTLVLIILATRSGIAAGHWYVAPGGGDGSNCQSIATPCATINGALARISADDTVFVAIGTYTGSDDEVALLEMDVTLSGGWDASFAVQSGRSTIEGEGVRRGLTVNQGVIAIVELSWPKNVIHAGISRFSSNNPKGLSLLSHG